MINEHDFMQAVYEEGQGSNKGRALGRAELEPSALVDLAHNPTTDDNLYKRLAHFCYQKGYIRRRIVLADTSAPTP